MKHTLIAKVVLILCIISIFLGFLCIDTENSTYQGNKIAVMELEGMIVSSYESGFFTKDTTSAAVLKSLKSAALDPNIKGIILKINSPGGTVAMSQNIYNQIIEIRKNKPVVAVIDDVAASGGYYIASAADRIVAQNGSLTGSIGVIFSFMDFHNFLIDKLDINPVVIKSGKYKDIGSCMRQMTPDEKKLMQNIIDDSYNQFLDAIRVGRIQRNDTYSAEKTQLKEVILKTHADGRVFTGNQAKHLGFVDVIGGEEMAQAMIEKMAQEKFMNNYKAKLVLYNKKSAINEYFSNFTEYGAKSQFKDLLPASMILNKRLLYLWE